MPLVDLGAKVLPALPLDFSLCIALLTPFTHTLDTATNANRTLWIDHMVCTTSVTACCRHGRDATAAMPARAPRRDRAAWRDRAVLIYPFPSLMITHT